MAKEGRSVTVWRRGPWGIGALALAPSPLRPRAGIMEFGKCDPLMTPSRCSDAKRPLGLAHVPHRARDHPMCDVFFFEVSIMHTARSEAVLLRQRSIMTAVSGIFACCAGLEIRPPSSAMCCADIIPVKCKMPTVLNEFMSDHLYLGPRMKHTMTGAQLELGTVGQTDLTELTEFIDFTE